MRRATRWILLGTAIATAAIVQLAPGTKHRLAAQEETEEENMRPCSPLPLNFVGSGFHQQKTFSGVSWTMVGAPTGVNTARYRSLGNHTEGITIDVTRKWEWLDPLADFRCDEIFYCGAGWIQRWHATWTSGNVVPYGEVSDSDITTSDEAGGGGTPTEEEETHYYRCWYYAYPDGTRSDYYRCDAIS